METLMVLSEGECFNDVVDGVPMKTQDRGARAENTVSFLLERKGWQLLERN